MYLIQGFFCQKSDGIGFSVDGMYDVIIDFDSVMFAGQIAHLDHDDTQPLAGLMLDNLHGKAVLSDIMITETEVSFLKRYIRGEGILGKLVPEEGISYLLHKGEDGTWVGEYSVPNGTNPTIGPVRCIVNKVKDELFQNDLDKFVREEGFMPAPEPSLALEDPQIPLNFDQGKDEGEPKPRNFFPDRSPDDEIPF